MSEKGYAASALCDANDSSRLSSAELTSGWGGPAEFMQSYGLKPYSPSDQQEALAISRAMRAADNQAASRSSSSSSSSSSKRR